MYMKVNDQPNKVHTFLKQNPKTAYCDDCLGKITNVNRHHLNTITSTISLFPKEFRRRFWHLLPRLRQQAR